MLTLLHEFEQAAWQIADADQHETWPADLRCRAIDLIDRANRAVAASEGIRTSLWMDDTDPEVVIARAFGIVHSRLATAVNKAAVRVNAVSLAA